MRWPFSRGKATTRPSVPVTSRGTAPPVPSSSHIDVSPAADVPPAVDVPLVSAAFLALPDIAGTRPLVPVVQPSLAGPDIPVRQELDFDTAIAAPALVEANGDPEPKTSTSEPSLFLGEFAEDADAYEGRDAPAVPGDDVDAGRDGTEEAPGQDLTGLIAMFDAEVVRGRLARGLPVDDVLSSDEKPSTLLRPTLSQSRRRGVSAGPTVPPGPAPSRDEPQPSASKEAPHAAPGPSETSSPRIDPGAPDEDDTSPAVAVAAHGAAPGGLGKATTEEPASEAPMVPETAEPFEGRPPRAAPPPDVDVARGPSEVPEPSVVTEQAVSDHPARSNDEVGVLGPVDLPGEAAEEPDVVPRVQPDRAQRQVGDRSGDGERQPRVHVQPPAQLGQDGDAGRPSGSPASAEKSVRLPVRSWQVAPGEQPRAVAAPAADLPISNLPAQDVATPDDTDLSSSASDLPVPDPPAPDVRAPAAAAPSGPTPYDATSDAATSAFAGPDVPPPDAREPGPPLSPVGPAGHEEERAEVPPWTPGSEDRPAVEASDVPPGSRTPTVAGPAYPAAHPSSDLPDVEVPRGQADGPVSSDPELPEEAPVHVLGFRAVLPPEPQRQAPASAADRAADRAQDGATSVQQVALRPHASTPAPPGIRSPDRAGTSAAPPAAVERPSVPSATIASFERLTGIDLGFVPVDRGPGADRTSGLNARGFTADGTIHVPADAGSLERVDNEALVAHELAHVAQQRAFGDAAAETSGAGQEWELQASAIERAFRGEEVTPDDWEAAVGPLAEAPFLSWTADDGFVSEAPRPAAGGVQRAARTSEGAPSPAASLERAGTSREADRGEVETVPLAYPEFTPHGPAHEEGDPLRHEATTTTMTEQDVQAIVQRVQSSLVVPSVDFTDPTLLEHLAVNLYDPMRRMLRSELITDRERSGVLTEFH